MGNNYIYIIYRSIICVPFSVIDSLRRIELFPCVIYWMQKLCPLFFWFNKYNYARLKYCIKLSIDRRVIILFMSTNFVLNVWKIYVFIKSLSIINIKTCINYIFCSIIVYYNLGLVDINFYYNILKFKWCYDVISW